MNTLPPNRPAPPAPAQPAQRPEPETRPLSVASIVAIISLAVCVVIALLLTLGVLRESYLKPPMPIGAPAPAPDAGAGGLPVLIPENDSLLRGFARIVLLFFSFIVGVIAMANAHASRPTWFARAFCCVFMVLSAILLLGASLKANLAGGLSLRDFISYLFLAIVFAIFGAILAAPGRLARTFKYFATPFIVIFLLHIALLVFAPSTTVNFNFLGNLVFLGVVAFICILCAYTDRLLQASERPQSS